MRATSQLRQLLKSGTTLFVPGCYNALSARILGDVGFPAIYMTGYGTSLALLGMLLPFHQRLKARLPDGVLGLIYLGVYAAGRFFLSFYRTDPAVFAGLRQAQLASLLMVVIAAVAIPVLYWRSRNTGKPTVTEAAAV